MPDSVPASSEPNVRPSDTDGATLTVVRRAILVILVIGLIGGGIELLLLRHFEEPAQVIAPGLLGVALAVVVWHLAFGASASLRALRVVMWLFVASGGLGIYLHYAANVEFQHEMDPGLHGRALVWKALAAKAPPALAPGAMAQLGLLGLAYTFRHPGFKGKKR